MANYEFKVLSNRFETVDNAQVEKVFLELGFDVDVVEDENQLVVYSNTMTFSDDLAVIRDKNNKVIGAYNSAENSLAEILIELNDCDTIDTLEVGSCTTQSLEQYIQEMLVEDGSNYFKITEVGSTKFRDVCGWIMVITPYHIQAYNLDMLADKFAEKSLASKGNEHFDEEKGEV